jgi:tetratricopeptide (TPR) repeat protein
MNGLTKILLLLSSSVTVYGCSLTAPVDDKSWKKSFDDGYRSMQARDLANAESNYRAALTIAQTFHKGDVRLAKTCDALGDVYLAEGKTEDAKRVYSIAYAEYKALWKQHDSSLDNRDYALGLATNALHLANFAFDSLRLDDAQRLYDEALSVEESALGSDSLKRQIYEGKAKLFKLTGRESEAEKIQRQIADLKALPSVDDVVNMSWKSLQIAGDEAFQAGNIAKAEKLFTASSQRADGPTQSAESLRGLARIYDQRKEFNRAIATLEQARRLITRNDDRRLDLADNLNSAGSSYLQAKDYSNAEKMFLEAMKALHPGQHADNERTKVSLSGLTKAYTEQGRDADAEKFAQRKLAITLDLYGKKDSRYAEDLLAVTILQAKQKKNAEAAKGFLTVIQLEEGNPSPRYMLAALDSYGKFLHDTKQDGLADTIELKAKNLRAEFE